MVWKAECENPDCSKNTWKLQKNPGSYSRGVTCPDCGTTQTHVLESGRGNELPDSRDQPATQTPEADRERSMGGAEAAIALFDEDVPTEKKVEATRTASSLIGDVAGSLLNYREEKKEAKDRRAQNVDIKPADRYPECECGFQFTGEDIGLSEETVKCPECGTVYELVDTPAEADGGETTPR